MTCPEKELSRDGCLALCISHATQGELLCWHCCHPFDSVAIPLPVSYDSRKDTWTYLGHFCSWGCAKAFNTDSKHVRMGERGMLLARLKFRVFGRYIPTIPSPPRQCLRAFGGTMTIDTFREQSPLGVVVSKLPRNMVPLENIITKRTVDFGSNHTKMGDRSDKMSKVSKPSSKSLKNESLRLKRNKPLPSEKTMGLERTMGLECFIVSSTSSK